MLFLSVADACRLLGIDPKTLRRWLAHAHLCLQPHPSDGRKHELSEDHLRQLARLHQRSLASLPQESSAPVPAALPPLPTALLALPETLGALQAQLAALQQQVGDLTHLLQQHAHPPAIPVAPVPQTRPTRKPAPPAPRSRRDASPVGKPLHKPVHIIPRVEWSSQGHYVVICPKLGLLALQPDSPPWFAWLATQSSFRFVGRHARFTAHHEVVRVPNGAWRAHRHIHNHSHNLRLGLTEELTIAVLEQAEATLQAHLK